MPVELPLDDNYNEIRRQIWLATDGAYKKALEDLSGKRAALQNKNRNDDAPDFTRREPASVSLMAATPTNPSSESDKHAAETLARAASLPFRTMTGIHTSHVRLSLVNTTERFVDSEGATMTRSIPTVTLQAAASTQAPDGMALHDEISLYSRSLAKLPPQPEIVAQVTKMGERLMQLQSAPLEEQYNGPVLFEDQAAVDLFARHFAESLPAEPRMLADNPQFLQSINSQQQANTLANKLNARVLPDFLSVLDDPTAKTLDGVPLMGAYDYDDEGTPAQQTLVVRNGILKTLLTSREPVHGVPQSTGNLRERGVAPSNLVVNASKTLTLADLHSRLLDMAKERDNKYGVIVRRLESKQAVLAFRLYPDGHEELIRNATLSGFSASAFKEIVAVSNQRTILTEAFANHPSSPFGRISYAGLGGGQTLVSYAVPAMLFEDLTIEKPSGEISRPPIVESPLSAK
jgi:predicted Zn-dependent protease